MCNAMPTPYFRVRSRSTRLPECRRRYSLLAGFLARPSRRQQQSRGLVLGCRSTNRPVSETGAEQGDGRSRVPGPRTAKMRPGAFDRGATLDPIDERIVATPRDMLDGVNDGVGAFCQFGESGSCPPCEMMGRRIEQEIRNAGHCRRDVRHANEDKAARFHRLRHLGEQGRGRLDMFEDFERADGIVKSRVLDKMLSERFVAHSIDRAAFGEVRVEPSVSRLWHA